MPKRHDTDYVFETATSDAGMNKRNKLNFHAFNPNGVIHNMPSDFSLPGNRWANGLQIIGGRFDSYHAKQLMDMASGKIKKFTTWELNYHIEGAHEDGEKARALLAERRLAYTQAC